MKVPGAILELPALPIQPIYLKIGQNWPDQQFSLAGSSKTAPRILIDMSAKYLSNVKFIAAEVPTFFGYITGCLIANPAK